MSERGLAPDVALAVESLRGETLPFWGSYSIPVEVVFTLANTKRDVAHGLGQIPDGYYIVEADGVVTKEPGSLPTKELYYLRATSATVHAIIIFFTLREVAHEA